MGSAMSDPLRIALVGATGLVGRHVILECVGRHDVRLAALARREMPLPTGARMEMFVAPPETWGDILAEVRPRALICALGTTWKKAGADEAAFRSVDRDLVLATARAAYAHGVERMVAVSSVGADPHGRTIYLRVKGEVEVELARIGFVRLDILRPGLLHGERREDPRMAERIGMVVSPLANLLLRGRFAPYRAIDARTVARAAVALAQEKALGRFVHTNTGIERAGR